MSIKHQPPFITLLLMISFASVNAVLFTPLLPEIALYFSISDSTAQLTITWFLVGYALGQLLYSPIANRFGRKVALFIGIIVQILSSLLCVLAGFMCTFTMLVVGRFFLALGAGVGLKMTFTLVSEIYEPVTASQKLSYLMIGFAITPGLGTMIGGYLGAHFAWTSAFYSGAIYGAILLVLVTRLPETKKNLDLDALQLNTLLTKYIIQFRNQPLLVGALLMGSATCFSYLFAALAPFIAINTMNMDISNYGEANLLPAIGLILGSIISAKLSKILTPGFMIGLGIMITSASSILMFVLILNRSSPIVGLFIPMVFGHLGLSLIFTQASTVAMSNTIDKAHGSAVMNFVNMGLATSVVLCASSASVNPLVLPSIYIVICSFMVVLYIFLQK